MNDAINGDQKSIDIQDTISKLKFLSKLKQGEKIQVNGLGVVGNTWWEKIIRHFYSKGDTPEEILESREISLHFIKEVCENGLKIAHLVVDKDGIYDKEVWYMIIKALKEFQPGIKNFMATYNDRVFASKVETFLDLLNAEIKQLEDNKKQLGSFEDQSM